MSFNITEQGRYAVLWYAENEEHNYMALVHQDEPGGPWKLTYRFRYFKDDKVFDSEDEKHWYEAVDKENPGPEKLVATNDTLLATPQAKAQYPKGVSRMEINGGMAEMLKVLMAQPWAHAKLLDKDGAEQCTYSGMETKH